MASPADGQLTCRLKSGERSEPKHPPAEGGPRKKRKNASRTKQRFQQVWESSKPELVPPGNEELFVRLIAIMVAQVVQTHSCKKKKTSRGSLNLRKINQDRHTHTTGKHTYEKKQSDPLQQSPEVSRTTCGSPSHAHNGENIHTK